MTTLLMIIAAIAIGLGIGKLDHASGMDKPKTKKPWKPKKRNWFVRQGELLDDDYYW